jgi:hypothetical protein
MSAESTPEPALAAPVYGELFLPVPDAGPSGPRQAVPDESEAAMGRLRTPFDVGPIDVAEPSG